MTEIKIETALEGAVVSENGAVDSKNGTAPSAQDTRPPEDADKGSTSYCVPFPIAIVGMAMKLPGGVTSAESFWEMLINKQDGHCEVPDTRYNVDAFYSPSVPGTVKTRHGYFLKDNIAQIDRSFFNMTTTEAGKLDPQQRLLLEVVWECMESGGQSNWRGKNVGCFVGVFGEDWLEVSTKDTQCIDRFHAMSTGDFAIANRISYEYDLKGPSITYRTACSSSMVGLHEACQALYSGECDSAVVGGSNLILAPTMTTSISDNMVLSPSGLCRTFDANADGYGRGEAINAIFIKPLADALREGDPIRAVIRSTATNCDGRTPTITTPGSEAQERLIRHAYQKAGIDNLSQTALFECHGTGTIAGDTAETSVVGRIFQKDGVYISAVKPNVGHSEGASGLTSIIKAALVLEKGVIPPNAHFLNPNPKIPFEEGKLTVPVEPMAWPEGKAKRVSVNSFGIGGTNVHAILDSFPPANSASPGDVPCSGNPRLLVVSTKNAKSLEERVNNIKQYLAHSSVNVDDLAYTLGTRRDHMKHRAFAIIDQDGTVSDFEKSRATKSGIAFVFSGQGAQWAGMGRELLSTSRSFCRSIWTMDQALKRLTSPPEWNLHDELLREDDSTRISEPEFCQPICTAIQIALTDILRAWGIHPDSVIGHSSGEIAAAYASGAINAQVAISLSYYRGQAMKFTTQRGGMAAIGMSPKRASKYLRDGIAVACENSPQSVTLSGDEDILAEVLEKIEADEPDTFCRRLEVSVAYHSDSMQKPGAIYERDIMPVISHSSTMTPLYSTVTGAVIRVPSTLDAAYWRNNLQLPVLFNDAVQTLIKDTGGTNIFVEIGPHSALSSPLRQILRLHDSDQTSKYIPTMIRNHPQQRGLLMAAGRLYSNGYPVQLSAINDTFGKVLTDLPSYPWLHDEDLWTETRLARQWRMCREPQHELLGSRCLESADIEPSWRKILYVDRVPWLLDHVMGEDVIFPCVGYIAMAGEAIRQITGSENYRIRNLLMKTPLVLKGSEPAEILTSLRPVRLTDADDSVWFEITIMAYQNESWKKHCVGQARAGTSGYNLPLENKTYPRSLPSKAWYGALKKRGFAFGPAFQRLENISASPSSCHAVASIRCHPDNNENHCDRYTLHPTSIDQALQLLGVAAVRGICRQITTFSVPISIESIDICPGDGLMSLHAFCNSSAQSITGDVSMVSEDGVVLSINNATLVSVDDHDSATNKVSMITKLSWKPHIDLINPPDQIISETIPEHLAKFLENFTHSLILDTAVKIHCLQPCSPHLKSYQGWISSQSNDLLPLPARSNVKCLDSLCKDDSFDESMEELEQNIPELHVLCSKARNISNLSVDLMEGKIRPEDVANEKDMLTALSDFLYTCAGSRGFFRLLGHSNPTIRVLVVGIGNGFAISQALTDLTSENGIPMYEKFTVTDTSADNISREKERHESAKNVEFTLLEISRDPVEQGLEPESYDLIIASEAFDTDSHDSSVFKNIYSLLAPGGRILYQGSWAATPLVTYVMAIYPTWWEQQGHDLKRSVVSRQDWQKILQEADLSDAAELTSHSSPYHLDTTIVSRPRTASPHRGCVALLYLSKIMDWARWVEGCLIQAGYTVTWVALGERLPLAEDVISLVDLEGPFFADMSEKKLAQIQLFASQMTHSRVLWVTDSSQMECKDPQFALALGFARTMRHEIMPDFATLEMDQYDAAGVVSLLRTLQHIQGEGIYPRLDPDREFAVHKGVIHVSRAHWTPVQEALAAVKPLDDYVKVLDIGTYGLLSSLAWRGQASRDLEDDEVEVEVKYCSLNFRDIMVAMGVVGDKTEFGLEGSGFIRRVGSSVKHVQVDQAVVIVTDGLLCTRKIVPAHCCSPLVPGLSLADAATVPSVFTTAIYSLIEICRLQEGQSVLIHSACGGVGLAAIQVCQVLGAKIFATVGSETKAQYLVESFGISRDRIFDSRSPSFFHGVMEQTGHRGVDIVLNSLSGELLHTSWKCVAKRGKMIELGKRDMLGHAQLDMKLFTGNRSFIGVDLKQLLEDEPESRSLIQQGMEYITQGKLKPIRPVTFFEAVDIQQAFGHMQMGNHMGKVVIKMPENSTLLPVTGNMSFFKLPPDVTFLLVGGLGGLGRAVATWMVEKGARNFVFLSRSAGRSRDSISFIEELESQNCAVTAVSGSVDDMHDVQRAVSVCKNRIAGVIQMSMVLKDQLLSKLTHDTWISTLAPKVQGTMNLHNALLGSKLDFFVCFSSIAGLCGNTGQSSYAAASSFLDAFVKYRQMNGLVASVIDVGLIDDVGFAYEHMPKVIQRAYSASMQTIGEGDLLQALELAMSQQGQFASGLGTTRSLSDPGVVPPWDQDARYSLWGRVVSVEEQSTATLHGDFKDLVEKIQRDPQILDDPATESQIIKVLGREIGSHLSNTNDMNDDEIYNMVIESLVMIEIRSWFRRHLKLEVSLLDISNASTIGGLGKVTVNALRVKYQAGDAEMKESKGPPTKSDDLYLGDLVLGRDFRPIAGPVPEWHSETEGHILLTGATGFLGAFLLSMLVALPKVHTVTCLIRAADSTAAMGRLDATFKKFNLSIDFQHKIRAAPGDISQRYLGLETTEFAYLAEKCSSVFHLGAVVNYTLPYSAQREVNVMGLVHVLSFANTHRLKSVHYFSGLAAYGPVGFLGGQDYIPENQRPVAAQRQLRHQQGYPLTKFVAESICWDVIANGFPLSIYRPGFVLGHSVTGVRNPDDAVNRFMSTCIRLGTFPQPPNQRNFFVPIDFVCSSAVHISLSNKNIGQAYNLIHPDQGQNISLSSTFNILSQLAPQPLRSVTFSQWLELVSGTKFHALSHIAPIIAQRSSEGSIWWDSENDDMVVYGTENLHRALENRPDILQCPSMTDLLELYFKGWSQ